MTHFPNSLTAFLLFFILISAQCARLQQDFLDAFIGCRVVPTAYADNARSWTCSYDRQSAKYACYSEEDYHIHSYPSTRDFIEEGQRIGRHRLTNTESSIAGVVENEPVTYDGEKRVLTMQSVLIALDGSVDTYTAWDSYGRQTTGTRDINGGTDCAGASVNRIYDDGALTVYEYSSGGVGPTCPTTSVVATFDANNNPIRQVGQLNDPFLGTIENTIDYTIFSTEKVCNE